MKEISYNTNHGLSLQRKVSSIKVITKIVEKGFNDNKKYCLNEEYRLVI